jgi:hypothetical protein
MSRTLCVTQYAIHNPVMNVMTIVGSVVDSLPPEVTDRSIWYGSEVARREDWVERLDEAEVAEVERVVHALEKSTLEITALTAKDTPLPTLAPRLRGMLDEVLNGRGFVLIRGLPVGALDQTPGGDCFSGDWGASRQSQDAEC